eukprot:935604-Pyramimonas_sp.AAC.1
MKRPETSPCAALHGSLAASFYTVGLSLEASSKVMTWPHVYNNYTDGARSVVERGSSQDTSSNC